MNTSCAHPAWRFLCATVALGALLLPSARGGEKKTIAVKVVTCKQLTTAVQAHKGKVVVIDVWGTFCIPCKKEFHNLIALHRQYPSSQLICMSVAVSPSETKEALAFLRSKGATFPNFLLNEAQSDKLAELWNFRAVPAIFVFDKNGKPRGFTLDDPRKQEGYKEVRAYLKKLLPGKR